jgi:hypothetical protein
MTASHVAVHGEVRVPNGAPGFLLEVFGFVPTATFNPRVAVDMAMTRAV